MKTTLSVETDTRTHQHMVIISVSYNHKQSVIRECWMIDVE